MIVFLYMINILLIRRLILLCTVILHGAYLLGAQKPASCDIDSNCFAMLEFDYRSNMGQYDGQSMPPAAVQPAEPSDTVFVHQDIYTEGACGVTERAPSFERNPFMLHQTRYNSGEHSHSQVMPPAFEQPDEPSGTVSVHQDIYTEGACGVTERAPSFELNPFMLHQTRYNSGEHSHSQVMPPAFEQPAEPSDTVCVHQGIYTAGAYCGVKRAPSTPHHQWDFPQTPAGYKQKQFCSPAMHPHSVQLADSCDKEALQKEIMKLINRYVIAGGQRVAAGSTPMNPQDHKRVQRNQRRIMETRMRGVNDLRAFASLKEIRSTISTIVQERKNLTHAVKNAVREAAIDSELQKLETAVDSTESAFQFASFRLESFVMEIVMRYVKGRKPSAVNGATSTTEARKRADVSEQRIMETRMCAITTLMQSENVSFAEVRCAIEHISQRKKQTHAATNSEEAAIDSEIQNLQNAMQALICATPQDFSAYSCPQFYLIPETKLESLIICFVMGHVRFKRVVVEYAASMTAEDKVIFLCATQTRVRGIVSILEEEFPSLLNLTFAIDRIWARRHSQAALYGDEEGAIDAELQALKNVINEIMAIDQPDHHFDKVSSVDSLIISYVKAIDSELQQQRNVVGATQLSSLFSASLEKSIMKRVMQLVNSGKKRAVIADQTKMSPVEKRPTWYFTHKRRSAIAFILIQEDGCLDDIEYSIGQILSRKSQEITYDAHEQETAIASELQSLKDAVVEIRDSARKANISIAEQLIWECRHMVKRKRKS